MSSDGSKKVTLSASLSYTNINGDTAVSAEPVEFVVTVPMHRVELDVPHDGSTNLSIGGDETNYHKTYIKNDGLAGKDPDDKYYMVCDSGGVPYISFPSSTAPGDNDVIEMSVLFTEECGKMSVDLALYKEPDKSTYDSYAMQLSISPEGFYRRNELLSEIELNKWYNIAIVCPTGGIEGTEIYSDGDGSLIGYDKYDRTAEIYVNGNLIKSHNLGYDCVGGVRHLRLNGTMNSLDPETPSFYLDNIRVHNDPYVPGYDMEADISMTEYGLDVLGETITITGTTTVEDIKNDIGESDYYTVRIYDPTGALALDNVVVTDGYTVVVAASNGTNMERAYSYYTVRVVDGKIAFDTPYITVDAETGAVESYVKVYNYTGEKAQYQLYLAIYNEDDSMKEIVPLTLEAESGMATDETLNGTLAEGEYAKFFIWKSDGINPELARVYAER